MDGVKETGQIFLPSLEAIPINCMYGGDGFRKGSTPPYVLGQRRPRRVNRYTLLIDGEPAGSLQTQLGFNSRP
jgi:hypothetical protein